MARSGKRLVVTYESKSGAVDRAVGMYGDYVFDSDRSTGGMFHIEEFVAQEMNDIYQARIFVPYEKS